MPEKKKPFPEFVIKYSNNGEHNYEGIPCAEGKVFQLIGFVGINAIDEKMKHLVKSKQEIYGKGNIHQSGLTGLQFLSIEIPELL